MTSSQQIAFEIVQQRVDGGQTQATTPKTPTSPNQNQEIRDAAQQLREAIQNNVRAELGKAQAQVAAEKAQAAAAKVAGAQGFVFQGPNGQGPTGSGPRGPFTIRTQDGTTIIQPSRGGDQGIPPEAVDISSAFFFTVAAIIILLPLARAFARRMDRRGGAPQIPAEVSDQLEHLNRAVDAIALEVERISEGQRFTTRLLTDQREAATSLTTGANR